MFKFEIAVYQIFCQNLKKYGFRER